MEFHSQNSSAETMCDALTPADSGACWFNAITSFVSYDGGRNFSRLRPAPDHLVAAQPYKMPPGGPGPGNKKSPMGYEAPSNIVRSPKDGYFYAAMQTWSFGAQQSGSEWQSMHGGWNGSGNCFIRTRQLTDPKSWRGWSGKTESWDVSFVDPYNDAPGSFVPADHVCTPVLNLGYPSIGWSSYYKKFIAVGSKIWDCSDIMFALSDDLVNWSAPYPLYQPICHTASPNTSYYAEIYPSLIDPASPSPNFDVIGQRPYIYFMTFHDNVKAPSGGTTVVRSIQRRPLEMGGAGPGGVEVQPDREGG